MQVETPAPCPSSTGSPPPHTPFTATGDLALDVVEQQAEHLRSVGVDGALIAGSTGEGSSLTASGRRDLAGLTRAV
ncbi:MAG: dihydrodipicolinate synthase family protein [Planctomycetota bacterium]|nr:dihydrodipicolinate synthase family protein [Planctomycetota bacterium]